MLELSDHEMDVLRTFGGHRYESQQIRKRLRAAGMNYCRSCNAVMIAAKFSGHLTICKSCDTAEARSRYEENKDKRNRYRNVLRRSEREAFRRVRSRRNEPDPFSLLSARESRKK